MSTRLKYQRPGVQFAVFFALAIGMFILNVVITQMFFGEISEVFTTKKDIDPAMLAKFKWMQFAGAILTFVLPPVIFGYMADDKQPWRYIGLKRNASIGLAFFTFLLLISVQPLALLLGQINETAHFGSAHELIKSTEEMYERIMSRFLVMDTPTDLLINMVIVALLPAIGEELFFRGCLQGILEKWTRSAIVSIGLSSFAFALLHGTFFKFLPIFCLGIVLGAIFYVTRNLWYSILFHFLNNTMALLASYYAQRNDFMKRLADEDFDFNWWLALGSLLVTVTIFIIMRRRVPYQPPEVTWKNPFDEFPTTPR
ncbi:MAG TPA: type II CAAX endopeptidase family protein [Chitinophagaceae bacterium]|nr:type II CAAX endopeptidase family protein [Chitinophagaceae bacterium]